MNKYRKDFALIQKGEWVYLNNAAQTLVPKPVIDEMARYYTEVGANVHRGVDSLGFEATRLYDLAREKVAKFLGAGDKGKVIFTRGATSALNLAARSYGQVLSDGDEIVVSMSEHHSNFVPYQQLAKEKNLKLVFVPLDERGSVTAQNLKSVLSPKTKIVAISHMTNVLGSINDIGALADVAHSAGAVIAVDGAQGAVHMPAEVDKNDIDFYALGAHKMLGPTGIGALYAKNDLLDIMPPLETGGDMVDIVTKEHTSYLDAPNKFEAGTPMIAEAIGWGRAIDYYLEIGYQAINEQIRRLRKIMVERMRAEIPDAIIYNEKAEHSPMVTFNIKGVHSHDVASVLDHEKVCVRAGHHCAQLIHEWLGIASSVRASLMFYNNEQDIDRFIQALKKSKDFINVLF
ncbi:MAG: cysteine desulfurase [Clostridiales bacterium]|nr:cysteine desulfurase [Clostridiales bacterium]